MIPIANVPRASTLGTLACAAVYLVSLFVVFGVVPNSVPLEPNAPFSTAVNTVFGGSRAGYVMGLAVVVSGFGALNGISAQIIVHPWKVWLPFIFCGAAFLMGIPVYVAQRAHRAPPQSVLQYEDPAKK